MKKNHFIARKGLFSLALAAVGAMFLGSCAEGFDSKETFDSGVYGVALNSPEITASNFTKKANSDGSESVQVSWKAVMGAGGYECIAYNVDDPENKIEVATDTVDSPVFTFKCADDTNYEVAIITLGNAKKNNSEAENATVASYSTLVPAQVIPQTEDVADFVNAHILDTNEEQAFELEANGQYTMNSEIDFQNKKVTFRGNKLHRPVLKLGANGVIRTSAQLKLKYLNIDCTDLANKGGVVELSSNPPASATAEAQGIGAGKSDGKPADCYILQDPIIFQECAFKNVPCCLFAVGQCAWGVSEVRVTDCIVQLNNNGSAWSGGSVISGYTHKGVAPSGGSFWSGGIQTIAVRNSTIFNIQKNSKNYFVRFTNKDLDRVFPVKAGSFTIENSTLSMVMTGKDFANNMPQHDEYVIRMANSIFYDTYRLQKINKGGCVLDFDKSTNAIRGITNPVDNTDKEKYATVVDDLGFVGPFDQALDFDKPNYGINFKATGSVSSTIGDPRWNITE